MSEEKMNGIESDQTQPEGTGTSWWKILGAGLAGVAVGAAGTILIDALTDDDSSDDDEEDDEDTEEEDSALSDVPIQDAEVESPKDFRLPPNVRM